MFCHAEVRFAVADVGHRTKGWERNKQLINKRRLLLTVTWLTPKGDRKKVYTELYAKDRKTDNILLNVEKKVYVNNVGWFHSSLKDFAKRVKK